jgi:hypothetical protein
MILSVHFGGVGHDMRDGSGVAVEVTVAGGRL